MPPFLHGMSAEAMQPYFARLAEVCGVTLFIFDLLDLRNVQTSRSMADRLGYTAAEFEAMGRGWIRTVLHPEDFERYLADTSRYHDARDDQAVRTEYRFRRKDGEYVWLASWATVVSRTPDGRPARAMGVSLDVTDQKKAAEERRALEERLRSTQRLESLGRLAGGVAHDFNNLLTVLLGSLDALSHEPHTDPGKMALDEMKDAVDRAVRLTRQLLSFARREAMHPRPVSVNDLVRAVLPLTIRLLPVDVTLETDLAPDLPAVSADPVQLEQVLMNLIVNARDAMPRAGKLRIVTGRRDQMVALTVEDDGVGMDASTVARIFDPFFTTKERGTGTGLGLAVSYGIVDQHGGKIEVDSAPGAGSRFRVLLPATKEGTAPAEAAGSAEAAVAAGVRILLAEDEPLILGLAKRVLEAAGYSVCEARSGVEAMARFAPGSFDLLVTDVIMPGMNGRELAETACGQDPKLAVMYMSGYTEEILHSEELRGAEFLPKPFTPSALVAAVARVLTRAASARG